MAWVKTAFPAARPAPRSEQAPVSEQRLAGMITPPQYPSALPSLRISVAAIQVRWTGSRMIAW